MRRAGAMPWFRHPERATRDDAFVFGHWSALGYLAEPGLRCLDTGCVWGGALTALRLDREEEPVQPALPQAGAGPATDQWFRACAVVDRLDAGQHLESQVDAVADELVRDAVDAALQVARQELRQDAVAEKLDELAVAHLEALRRIALDGDRLPDAEHGIADVLVALLRDRRAPRT